MSKPIKQTMEFAKPVQFIGILKRIQGLQEGDVVIEYPMVDSHTVELDEDNDEMVIRLKLSSEKPPDDWATKLCFQNAALPEAECEHVRPINIEPLTSRFILRATTTIGVRVRRLEEECPEPERLVCKHCGDAAFNTHIEFDKICFACVQKGAE